MQNTYAKTYLYVLAAISAANLLLGILYVATKNIILGIPLLLFSFAEIIVLIMSVIMIVKVFTKKLNRINLIMPVFYLFTGIALSAYDIIAGPDIGDRSVAEGFLSSFDLSSPYNLIMFTAEVTSYTFLIGFSIYLLKNDGFFRQGD